MVSYQAYLEIQSCNAKDGDDYKIVVRNKEIRTATYLLASDKTPDEPEGVKIPVVTMDTKSYFSLTKDVFSKKTKSLIEPDQLRQTCLKKQRCEQKNACEPNIAGDRSVLDISVVGKETKADKISSHSDNHKKQNASTYHLKNFSENRSRSNEFQEIIDKKQSTVSESSLNIAMHPKNKDKNDVDISTEPISTNRFSRLGNKTETPSVSKTENETSGNKNLKAEEEIQTKAPVVLSTLSSKYVTVRSGDSLTLSCFVCGSPKPEIIWKKDSIEIVPDAKHAIDKVDSSNSDEESFLSVLKVSKVDLSYCGIYTATAFNANGEANCEMIIDVITLDYHNENQSKFVF